MKNLKFTLLIALFTIGSIGMFGQRAALDCPGGTGSQDVRMGPVTSESTDSLTALKEYGAAAAKKTNLKCSTATSCDDGKRCKKKTTGVGADGSIPTPTQTVTGEWEFPDMGSTTVFVKCVCVLARIEKFEHQILEGGYQGFDPIIGEGDDPADFVSVYPNPARDHLNINFADTEMEGEVTVFVHNSMGQQIRKVQIDPAEDALKTIDTSNFNEGLYFMTITKGKELISKAKFFIVEE